MIRCPCGDPICDKYLIGDGRFPLEEARLYEGAPDLLAALNDMLDCFPATHYRYDRQVDARRAAMAAIAKATVIKSPTNESLLADLKATADRPEPIDLETAAVLMSFGPAKQPSLVDNLLAALKDLQSHGCPVCSGDCGSANPPVTNCPMARVDAAIAKAEGR